MGPVEIAAICIVGVAAVGAIGYLIYRKVKHKGACCDCGSCSDCPHCNAKEE